jgi:DNA-binding NtrC family response regulator
MNHPWPGNVRQLESAVERAYILCESRVIGPDHLPDEIKAHGSTPAFSRSLKPMADFLIDSKLTAAEYRLYLYLLKCDCDELNGHEGLEPKLIMERLGISKETFYTGIARLRDLGLYDFKSRMNPVKSKPDLG